MKKVPFVTKEQVEKLAEKYPTPFYVYDEKGIRETVRSINKAFAWNKGFKEYFAVKATPLPGILRIMKEEGCGTDCSSYPELVLSDVCGFKGHEIMFSSNDTPVKDMQEAYKLGSIINLDDFTMIEFLEQVAAIPETICCRFNPGGVFALGNDIMDNPGDAKYGMTRDQLRDAFKILKAKGVKHFGIHAFLASNTVTNAYYPELARQLFQLAVDMKQETGVAVEFINLSGGVGIPYRPEQTPNDIAVIGEGVRKVYEEVLTPAGMGNVSLFTEMGRFVTGPYGALVTKVLHFKHTYKEYVGVDACAANLMRPAMYGASITSRCWGRKANPVTTPTTLLAGSAKTTISSPSTGNCRKSTKGIIFSSMMPGPTVLPWATTTMPSCGALNCC